MRSTLALLLFFGTGIWKRVTATHTCTKYELPTAEQGSCEYEIDYRARDDKQALATCLEYFPTTFVKGRRTSTGITTCTVTAAYQCVEPDTFLIFDKCYKFPKDNNVYTKGTITDYTDKTQNLCQGGKLSVFYSHTHAKFVGMKAHRLNIDKLWIGITKDGRTIEADKDGKNPMIHSKMWKLVENDYWDGEELKPIPPLGENQKEGSNIPDEANFYFMRTRTDHVYNRVQGHFERASAAVKATFACEFESVYTANQAWYCNKLGRAGLGLDAVYDGFMKPHRCLYVTANSYSFKGDNRAVAAADMKNIKGCHERPSLLHSSEMDDGTADYSAYKDLSYSKYKQGKLRIAGHIVEIMNPNPSINSEYAQGKCNDQVTFYDNRRTYLTKKWEYINHHGKSQSGIASQIPWDDNYPKNECTDFPGKSSTVGLKSNERYDMVDKKIDMPPEVRAPALCSLIFFQECGLYKPCGKLECVDKDSYQKDTGSATRKTGFFTCQCPGADKPAVTPPQPYTENTDSNGVKTCKWTGGDDKCAWLHFYDGAEVYHTKNHDFDILSDSGRKYAHLNDKLDRMVVRDGCKVSVWSGAVTWTPSFDFIKDAGYGSHHVPNTNDGSLPAEWVGDAASRTVCSCN